MRLPIGDRLRDQVCLVTGAASGLGKAIALRFAKEGARVAMDVTSEEQVNCGVAENCLQVGRRRRAGQQRRHPDRHPVEDFPFADWKKMLAIHLDGAFLTTRACVPHMKRSGRGGSIIYMGSVHSKEASVLKSAYEGGRQPWHPRERPGAGAHAGDQRGGCHQEG